MPSFKAKRVVAVPSGIAYAVASDVGAYREFLPLLEESTVIGTVRESNGGRAFRARLVAGYAKLGLREQFVSDVSCDPSMLRVMATSQDAPFKQMKTVWKIVDRGNQSDVSVEIDYAMRNAFLQMALAGVMELAVNKAMAAFEKRALAVYAASSASSRSA